MLEDRSSSRVPAGRSDRELIASARLEWDAASLATERLRLPDDASWPDCLKQELSIASDSIPGYAILREIHRGAQGIVYEGIQRTTRRQVAIKIMREGPFAGRQDKARFEREVQVLAAIKHPNIVAIHDSGTVAGSFYFVMDYIDGQPLDAHMDAERPGLRETLVLFQKICEAVNAAHLRGVIHRDLKPGNIRIDSAGEPQILDFGLAKVVPSSIDAGSAPMTVTGQFVGSLPWASPEQAEGVPARIDVRTDVYALGVILYHMLTGRFPYEVVGGMRDVLDRIMTVQPLPPSTAGGPGGRSDDELDTIVLKALSKERERRYQSAGELARDIKHYLADEPIEAKRDSSWYLLRKNLYRHRAAAAVAAGFVLLLAIGLLVSLALWQRSLRARAVAEAEHLLAQRHLFEWLLEAGYSRVKSKQYADARQAYTEAWELARQLRLPDLQPRLGWLNSYMISPPPLLVHEFGPEDAARPPRSTILCVTPELPLVAVQRGDVLYLLNPLTWQQVGALPGHLGAVRGLAASPDGRQLLTGAQDRMVRLFDAAGRQELRCVSTDAPVIKCAFSPDGGYGYWSEDDGKVMRWDLTTGETTLVAKTPIPELHLFASPDARWLGAGGPACALIDADARQVARGMQGFGAMAFSDGGACVLTGHRDKALRLWDVASGELIRRFSTASGLAFSLAISPDEQTVLEGQDDGAVQLWEIATGNELASWSGHTARVDGVAFLPGASAAVSCSERECLVWNIPSATGVGTFRAPSRPSAVAISPDGHTALCGDADGLIHHWDVATRRQLGVLPGHSGTVQALAFLPDGTRALSCAADGPLQLWDLISGTQIARLEHPQEESSAATLRGLGNVVVSRDGRTALSSAYDGSLWLWDLQSHAGRRLRERDPDSAHVLSVCFSDDGRSALTGHRGGGVILWDTETGAEKWRTTGHRDSVNAVAFLPGGRTGLSVSADNLLILWDLTAGRALRTFAGPQVSWVSRAVLARDGQTVYCSSADGVIRVWSLERGKPLCALTRHAVSVRSLVLSEDGRVLLAASDDGTVSIWDSELPKRYQELELRAAAARKRLTTRPNDPAALLALGEWLAFREADELAVRELVRAREAGAAVPGMLLGRCYWRLGQLKQAHGEFRRAEQAGEAPATYLRQCLKAMTSPVDFRSVPASSP